MKFIGTGLDGSYLIELDVFTDNRGWFARTYSKDEFSQIGHTAEWVQLNHSFTTLPGTIRGMHFQHFPFKEIKLVRCIAGTVYDVLVDLRRNSPTFLQWKGFELSANNKRMLYIPEGFAHGFQSCTPDCELIYHHTAMYNPAAEAGIRYNDARINISWPFPVTEISQRDREHPVLDPNFKGI